MKKDELKQNVKSYAQKFEDGGLRLLKKGQKGVIHAIFSRFGLVLLLLLLQVGLLVSIFRWFGNLLPHYFGGSVVVTAAMVLYLLNSKMDNSAKITWMVVIALFPVVGVPLFFYVKSNFGHNILRKRLLELEDVLRTQLPQNQSVVQKLEASEPGAASLATYLYGRGGGFPVYENTAVKRRMAVIGDDWYYFPQANIREMAHFFAGLYPAFSWERYEKLKQVFPLDEKMMLRRMSKGMQKQAAFWLTVCCMPEYLILDEPVDGLDPVMRRQVWSLLLGDVAERGTTVLVSSHNLRELEDVCDHVGILNHGKVLLERSLSDLQDNTVKLQVAYQGVTEPPLPAELNILHRSHVGRVYTYIIRGSSREIMRRMQITEPVLLESIPLTLEEIFIYELGGVDYAAKDILL